MFVAAGVLFDCCCVGVFVIWSELVAVCCCFDLLMVFVCYCLTLLLWMRVCWMG